MALIVFAALSFLACGILLFVLFQRMRDAKHKTTIRPAVGSKGNEMRGEGHLYIVHSRSAGERRDRFKAGANRVSTITERSARRDSGYDELERMAYERIARCWRPGKRN